MRRCTIAVALATLIASSAVQGNPLASAFTSLFARTRGSPSNGAADAVNAFGFELLGRARGEAGQGNLVYSPLSISSAFALVYLGAEGNTKSELESVFGFEGGVPDALITKAVEYGEGTSGEVTIANRAYIADSVPVKSSYTNAVQGTQVQPIDFSGDPEGARQEVNGFVARVTRQLIPELLPLGFVNSQTRFLVANAVYFKGTWKKTFPTENTFTEKFRGVDGDQDVEYMEFNRPEPFNIRRLTSLESWILELPYTGDRFSMFVILPNRDDGWSAVESQLEGMSYEDLFVFDTIRSSTVVLPKFELEVELSKLREHVIGLGAPTVFSNAADLSGITDSERLPLTDAVHKAKIKVDEQGTEAAAATGVASSRSAFAGNMFVVDHPFLFFVVDKKDGIVFFQGTVTSI